MTSEIESDIKVSKNELGDLNVDLIAHCMKSNENSPEKMEIYYAAGLCAIKNPHIENLDNCEQLLDRMVTSVLQGITLPGIDDVKQQLINLGKT